MTIKEQDIVLVQEAEDGTKTIQLPITRVENVEGAIKTINGQAPDKTGNVVIDTLSSSITATADVVETTGKPEVTVTKSGTDKAPVFKFSFKGLKGEPGVQGPEGKEGPKGDTGPAGKDADISKVIAKTGDRGQLSGWEDVAKLAGSVSITINSPDNCLVTDIQAGQEIHISTASPGKSSIKVIRVVAGDDTWQIMPTPESLPTGVKLKWNGGSIPKITENMLIVLHYTGNEKEVIGTATDLSK